MMNVRNVFVGLIVSGVLAGSSPAVEAAEATVVAVGVGEAARQRWSSARRLSMDSSRYGATGIGRGAVVVNPARWELPAESPLPALPVTRLPRTFTAPIPLLPSD